MLDGILTKQQDINKNSCNLVNKVFPGHCWFFIFYFLFLSVVLLIYAIKRRDWSPTPMAFGSTPKRKPKLHLAG